MNDQVNIVLVVVVQRRRPMLESCAQLATIGAFVLALLLAAASLAHSGTTAPRFPSKGSVPADERGMDPPRLACLARPASAQRGSRGGWRSCSVIVALVRGYAAVRPEHVYLASRSLILIDERPRSGSRRTSGRSGRRTHCRRRHALTLVIGQHVPRTRG